MDEPSVCKITNTLLNDFAHNRLGNTSFRMNSNIEHDKKKLFLKPTQNGESKPTTLFTQKFVFTEPKLLKQEFKQRKKKKKNQTKGGVP